MAYSYDDVGPYRVKKTRLDLSHEKVFTADLGRIYPVYTELCNPNEDFNINLNSFIRFNPLIHPLMHNVTAYFHFFFVPLRLIHYRDGLIQNSSPTSIGNLNFEDFITGGLDGLGVSDGGTSPVQGGDIARLKTWPARDNPVGIGLGTLTTDTTIRTLLAYGPGSLWDFFGFPVALGEDLLGSGHTQKINLDETTAPLISPYLAYDMIYFYYYEDSNFHISTTNDIPELHNSVKWYDHDIIDALNYSFNITTIFYGNNIVGGPDEDSRLNKVMPRTRAYPKDYFTSAQPNAQRGVPGVLSTQGFLPIENGPSSVGPLVGGEYVGTIGTALNTTPQSWGVRVLQATGGSPSPIGADVGINAGGALFDVNQLILAYSMQNFAQINQRFGTRYSEWIYGQFNQVSPDSRLQRPEYIGGMAANVVFSEVLQTSEGNNTSNALGDLGGHGISVGRDFISSYHTPEYGIIMGLMSVMPKSSYGQGINRQWIKNSRYDFYVPAFAYIGEQGIYEAEIYGVTKDDETPVSPSKIFGYQAAWDEYRQHTDSYHGLMHAGLSSWHMGRVFSVAPNLGLDFINTNEDDWTRNFCFQDEPQMLCNLGLNITATRPMPYMSIPHIDGGQD